MSVLLRALTGRRGPMTALCGSRKYSLSSDVINLLEVQESGELFIGYRNSSDTKAVLMTVARYEELTS